MADPSTAAPDIARIRELVPQLFALCAQIEAAAGGRPCQPSGHVIGTIGELLVCDRLGLTMAPSNTERFDAFTGDGQPVQIKTTAGRYVPLWHGDGLLAVAVLSRDGDLEIAYFGPASVAWDGAGKQQKRGLRPITVSKLRGLARNDRPGIIAS